MSLDPRRLVSALIERGYDPDIWLDILLPVRGGAPCRGHYLPKDIENPEVMAEFLALKMEQIDLMRRGLHGEANRILTEFFKRHPPQKVYCRTPHSEYPVDLFLAALLREGLISVSDLPTARRWIYSAAREYLFERSSYIKRGLSKPLIPPEIRKRKQPTPELIKELEEIRFLLNLEHFL